MPRFRVGNEEWELCIGAECKECEPVRQLKSYDDTMAWLRRYRNDSGAMSKLRSLLRQLEMDPVHRLDDDAMLDRIAGAIGSGRVRLCNRGKVEISGGAAGAAAKVKQDDEEQLAVSPQPRKTWVEFAVIDMEGNPVSDRKYRVMLPDGSLHEGVLDHNGILRFSNIDPENSVFSLSELDRDAWERVS